MRDAKIFWYVDRLPPAPHSWNKHYLIYWPLGMIFSPWAISFLHIRSLEYQ